MPRDVNAPAALPALPPHPADAELARVVAAAAARPPASAGSAVWPESEEVVRAVKVELHTLARA